MKDRIVHPSNDEELAEAVELAFDYRGDVTLHLDSGKTIEGYVFNRGGQADHAFIDLFCKDDPLPVRIPCRQIRSIAFTGEDPASGKSWQAWIKKKEEERLAESRHLESEARARGHL